MQKVALCSGYCLYNHGHTRDVMFYLNALLPANTTVNLAAPLPSAK
jgi:hypothetical protein